MSDTRTLVGKISALRQRLEQAHGLADEARAAAALLEEQAEAELPPGPLALWVGGEQGRALDEAVRPLTGPGDLAGSPPKQLTSRARRVLERGRELLGQLRALADLPAGPEGGPAALPLYGDTVAMIDTALRTVALLPDSATAQMHLCRGLEVTLDEVRARLATLTAGREVYDRRARQVATLAAALRALHDGQAADGPGLYALADEVLGEAGEGEVLGFLDAPADEPALFAACHGLTVARVMARALRGPDVPVKPREAVLVALLHDVGMLAVPGEVLGRAELLEGDDRRVVEAHAAAGARLVAGLFADQPWLAEAVAGHHERLDGTGYPDGLQGNRITPLARLLAVCDVYAAMCCDRPHRPARSTRTAMADTLLLADQGQLDRDWAEALLALSFYPVGSVVELSHGSVGVVVATPGGSADLSGPARPVVALLTDAHGEPLPRPRHLDLAASDAHTIVRPLPPAERDEVLRRRFPEWALLQ